MPPEPALDCDDSDSCRPDDETPFGVSLFNRSVLLTNVLPDRIRASYAAQRITRSQANERPYSAAGLGAESARHEPATHTASVPTRIPAAPATQRHPTRVPQVISPVRDDVYIPSRSSRSCPLISGYVLRHGRVRTAVDPVATALSERDSASFAARCGYSIRGDTNASALVIGLSVNAVRNHNPKRQSSQSDTGNYVKFDQVQRTPTS